MSLHDWQDKLRKIHVQPESNQHVSLNILLEWDEIGRIATVRPFDRPWSVSTMQIICSSPQRRVSAFNLDFSCIS